MKRALILLGLLALACDSATAPPVTDTSSPVAVASPSAAPIPTVTPVAETPSACHLRGQLPDPVCTPGATNPAVTPDTIHSTICVSGWTATIRPPSTYTDRLKVQGIAAYGYTDTNPRDYEEDHLVPLELGGAPSDPRNLWPEPGATPNAKDSVENDLHRKVCLGVVSLIRAQQAIATDWTTAEQVVSG